MALGRLPLAARRSGQIWIDALPSFLATPRTPNASTTAGSSQLLACHGSRKSARSRTHSPTSRRWRDTADSELAITQDREKAQKKLAASGKGKPKESATSLRARQEIDAAAMRAKNARRLPLERTDRPAELMVVSLPAGARTGEEGRGSRCGRRAEDQGVRRWRAGAAPPRRRPTARHPVLRPPASPHLSSDTPLHNCSTTASPIFFLYSLATCRNAKLIDPFQHSTAFLEGEMSVWSLLSHAILRTKEAGLLQRPARGTRATEARRKLYPR